MTSSSNNTSQTATDHARAKPHVVYLDENTPLYGAGEGNVPEDDSLPNWRAPASLLPAILENADQAGRVLAYAAVKAHAREARNHADDFALSGDNQQVVVQDVIAQHVRFSGIQGGTAGAAFTFFEVTSFVGPAGVLTVPAALGTLAMDLSTLAWVQARMVLHIAALYGYDPASRDRVDDLAALWDLETSSGVVTTGKMIWNRRHGPTSAQLTAARTLASMVGMGSLFGRLLPIVNVPIAAFGNAKATRELGELASRYFSKGRDTSVISQPLS